MADTPKPEEAGTKNSTPDTAAPDFSKYDKDMLATYAKDAFGVDLNKRKKLADLRAEVGALQRGEKLEDSEKEDEKAEKPDAKFLRHPGNGRVFPATKALLSRPDMVPCDADGKDV